MVYDMNERVINPIWVKVKMEGVAVVDLLKTFIWAPIAAWFWSSLRKQSDQFDNMKTEMATLKATALTREDARTIMQEVLKPLENGIKDLKDESEKTRKSNIELSTKVAIMEAIKEQCETSK